MPQTCFIEIFKIEARPKLITRDPVTPALIIVKAVVKAIDNSKYIRVKKIIYLYLEVEGAGEKTILDHPLRFRIYSQPEYYFVRLVLSCLFEGCF